MIFDRRVRSHKLWKKKFAWFPVKGQKTIYYKDGNTEKPCWIWWEFYWRFSNFGAPVNYTQWIYSETRGTKAKFQEFLRKAN